ncbi:hypothetical protein P7C73_g6806, partial [Tremellales sp. Uapishka_1]
PAPVSDAPPPLLNQDDLFHPLSQSPLPPLRAKGDRIKALSLCPVSLEKYNERIHPAFECPDCGFPTHATEARWLEGKEEHEENCRRLREVNEDEHDLRSGREMVEFENMPGPQPYESSVSFTSWDTLFFTRNFVSVDSDRAIRHISKLLTYPITIAGVLHQNGPYTSGNGRITREGRRSMAAVHSVLHLPPGSTSTTPTLKPSPPFRLFLLGARAESTLPPSLWSQLTHLFPRTSFHIYFIGPEVGIPLLDPKETIKARKFTEEGGWGVPSHTLNVTPQLSLTSLRSPYEDVHDQLGPFDPYTDVFFAFSPGLGFPTQPPVPAVEPGPDQGSTAAGAASSYSPPEIEDEPTVQAQTTWKRPLQKILTTKCALFFTAFSPTDLSRDVAALSGTAPPAFAAEFPSSVTLPTGATEPIEGVTDEFELVLTPGKNTFTSEKWEIAEWDTRVGVKTNYGVWGIRGRRYEVVEGEEKV